MKAVNFPARSQVSYTTLPDPVAGPGEVVVQVKASGICHTDYEVLKANYGSSAFPVVPGHEYTGIVADVGPDVAGVAVGDRVASIPTLNAEPAATVAVAGRICAKSSVLTASPRTVDLPNSAL